MELGRINKKVTAKQAAVILFPVLRKAPNVVCYARTDFNHRIKQMDKLYFLTILISPFLLLATYILTARTKTFKKIFIVHTIVFLVYMTFVINYSKLLTGHDEYGLGQLGLGITFIVIHIIIGFVHGLYLNYKDNKSV